MNVVKKIKARLTKMAEPKDSHWIKGNAVYDAFGEHEVLGAPNVSRPTDAMLAGQDIPEWPSYIALEVTNVCNLECTHCNYRHGVAHYTRDRGDMVEEVADKVLDEAAKYGATVLMNYDGEPLMNKRFIEYLRLAESKGVKSYFNTNGMLFSEKFANELLTFYSGSVFFSVDGSREWFENIRVGGDYDLLMKNLDYFLEANEKAGWPIGVGVSLCNLGQTAEEREDFVNRWIDKVSFVSLGEVNNKDGSMISEPMTTFEVNNRPICNNPWQTVGICHNGDVVPCSIYITRANTTNAILGNVNEKSIEEIWMDKPIQSFRKMLASGDIENTYCKTCERWRCQYSWPDKVEGSRRIERNGYWTTVHNLDRPLPKGKGG